MRKINFTNVFGALIAISVLSTPFAVSAQKKKAPAARVVTSVKVTGTSASVPMASSAFTELLSGKQLQVDVPDEFSKLSFSFEPELPAKKIVVENCTAESINGFKDGIEFYSAAPFRRFFVEAGLQKVTLDLGTFNHPLRVLTMQFRHNQKVCLKSLTFLDAKDRPIKVEVATEIKNFSPAPESSAKLRERFTEAGMEDLLDQELIPQSEDEKWVFRFRSDGSFFVFGTTEEMKTAGRFSAIGKFDIEELSKNKIKFAIEGDKVVSPDPWDGWLCEGIIGSCKKIRPSNVTKVFDSIVLEKMSNGTIVVRNRAQSKRRTLPFTDLRVRISTL